MNYKKDYLLIVFLLSWKKYIIYIRVIVRFITYITYCIIWKMLRNLFTIFVNKNVKFNNLFYTKLNKILLFFEIVRQFKMLFLL